MASKFTAPFSSSEVTICLSTAWSSRTPCVAMCSLLCCSPFPRAVTSINACREHIAPRPYAHRGPLSLGSEQFAVVPGELLAIVLSSTVSGLGLFNPYTWHGDAPTPYKRGLAY